MTDAPTVRTATCRTCNGPIRDAGDRWLHDQGSDWVASPHAAHPAPPSDYDTYTGADDQREYLLTVWADGTSTVAVRPLAGGTWGPPVEMVATR